MRRFACALIAFSLLATATRAADNAEPKESSTVLEFSKPLPKAGFQGTVGYRKTEREGPFLARVNEEPIDLWAGIQMPPAQGEKPDPKKEAAEKAERDAAIRKANAYRLIDQAGKYVGWFGIVRGFSKDKQTGRTELLIEHQYCDGLSDPDLQVVSAYGAGDFNAVLRGPQERIPPLALVRVYGKASKAPDGTPRVDADYIRVWDWGLFTFMDYGPDRSNPKWVALRKIAGRDVYNPRPTATFYEHVLGTREEANAATRPGGEQPAK